jgi:hypothetical protein
MNRWTPSIVPGAKDQTVYLVLNDFGRLGRSYMETDEDKADLETTISDLLQGQYSNPVDVFAFNAAEGWARDVSKDIADEIRYRCDRRDIVIPAHLEDFMHRHENRDRAQLSLV